MNGRAGGERVTEILPCIADDPQSVGRGVEVHAERSALESDGEFGHLECLRCVGVDRVDAPAIAQAVQLPVLNAEIDAYKHLIVVLQTRYGADLLEPRGPTLIEFHQPLIEGEAKDRQARGPTEVGALAAERVPIGGGGG